MASNKHTFIVPIKEGTVGEYTITAFDKRTNLYANKSVNINIPMYIRGTVTSTSRTPKLYINEQAVNATLDGTNWKADISSVLPTGSLYNFLYNYRSSNNTYVDTIEFPENFDTSNVTTMQNMFMNCSSLASIGDISNWDVKNVTTMKNMFYLCRALASIGDLSNWNTGNVTDMSTLFNDCRTLTSVGDLSNWNTGNVTTMKNMFYNCNVLTSVGDLSNWDTSKVTDMSMMFMSCSALASIGDLSNWDTSKVTDMSSMFYACRSLTTLGLPPIGNGTTNVTTTSMLLACSKLTNITAAGPIHNSLDFSQCSLTLDSAKVVLNALQSPYNGAQTLTFSTATKNLVKNDSTAMSLVTTKRALGWTISI